MKIKVKYLVEGLDPIAPAHVGEWIDLRAASDIWAQPMEFVKIPLGVAIQLPAGFEAIMVPRSSTFENYGIIMINSVGVIDNRYCGDNDEWSFPALATRRIHIPKNARICQFRLLYEQPNCEITPVDILGNEDRGGFGSTGEM